MSSKGRVSSSRTPLSPVSLNQTIGSRIGANSDHSKIREGIIDSTSTWEFPIQKRRRKGPITNVRQEGDSVSLEAGTSGDRNSFHPPSESLGPPYPVQDVFQLGKTLGWESHSENTAQDDQTLPEGGSGVYSEEHAQGPPLENEHTPYQSPSNLLTEELASSDQDSDIDLDDEELAALLDAHDIAPTNSEDTTEIYSSSGAPHTSLNYHEPWADKPKQILQKPTPDPMIQDWSSAEDNEFDIDWEDGIQDEMQRLDASKLQVHDTAEEDPSSLDNKSFENLTTQSPSQRNNQGIITLTHKRTFKPLFPGEMAPPPRANSSSFSQQLTVPSPSPFLRSPFPSAVPSLSPIRGLSSASTLRTCFRIAEAVKVMNSTKSSSCLVLELYAWVTESYVECSVSRGQVHKFQHFSFADLFFPNRSPYLSGTWEGWSGTELLENDSRAFLGQRREAWKWDWKANVPGRMARAIAQVGITNGEQAHSPFQSPIRPQAKSQCRMLRILSIWKTDWDDVEYVRGIVES